MKAVLFSGHPVVPFGRHVEQKIMEMDIYNYSKLKNANLVMPIERRTQ